MSNKALVPLGLIAVAGVMGSMIPAGQANRRERDAMSALANSKGRTVEFLAWPYQGETRKVKSVRVMYGNSLQLTLDRPLPKASTNLFDVSPDNVLDLRLSNGRGMRNKASEEILRSSFGAGRGGTKIFLTYDRATGQYAVRSRFQDFYRSRKGLKPNSAKARAALKRAQDRFETILR